MSAAETFLGLKRRAGVLVHDWPRYRAGLNDRGNGWLRICNRHETLEPAPDGIGVKCEWRWTSALYALRYMPGLGRRLLERALAIYPVGMEWSPVPPATSGNPDISFVVGHRGEERLPNLIATLGSIAAQRDARIECVVVEQAAQPSLQERLPEWVRYHFSASRPAGALYNRSQALNDGAVLARGRLLVLHDNDMLVPVCYARDLLARWRAGAQVVNLKRFIFYLGEADSRATIEARRVREGIVPEEVIQNLTGGGSLAVDRDWYFAVGGHDEGFVGWGGEDVDFWDRAVIGRLYSYAHLPIIHLWHRAQPDKTATKDSVAMQRLARVSEIPVPKRIARLRAGQPLDEA